MGVIAELGRLAVAAWSPGGAGGGFIASGTYAGASDTSLASPGSLEILSVDLLRSKLLPVTEVPVPEKFCSIDWGNPARTHPAGLIAGGLADGTVRIWDAATLMRPKKGTADGSTALIYGGLSSAKKHTAAVRALAFNPFIPTRLATGGADGQVLVWELANLSAGPSVRPPAGQPTAATNAPKEEVSAVAWNQKVQHILGTGTSSGMLNVWDLKQSKQVISIRNPRGRLRCSSLAWHPDIPTQIIITCDQDESTGAIMYDLRNASSPCMSLTHHGSYGVSSTSWCPHDSDLLLTSSQDSRTVVSSISSGEIVSEAPPTANWNFDVRWSSRLPGLYLASTFDGRITVNSMLTATTAPSVSSETANALAESFGEAAGGFQSGVVPQSPKVRTPRVSYHLNRPPKWLKRPVSVSFGFGGYCASFTPKDEGKVKVETFPERFAGLKESSAKLDEMLMDLTSDDPSPALRWCQHASSLSETPTEKMAWDAVGFMFQTDARRGMLEYLGYELPPLEAGDDIAMPVYGLGRSAPLAVPVRPVPSIPSVTADIAENKLGDIGDVDLIANGTSTMNLEGPAPWELSNISGGNVNLKDSILDGDDTSISTDKDVSEKTNGFTSPGKERYVKLFADKSLEQIGILIKRSVVVGDLKTAVGACLHVGRTADALIIAHAGGPDLWLQTQADYISKSSASNDASILGAIAGPKSSMDAFISDAADAAKDSWKEALALILTYSPTEDISEYCSVLGQRLLIANQESAALFCFICAGNTRMATTVWMRERPLRANATCAMMADRIERLGILVKKVRILTAASVLGAGEREIGTVKALDEVSGSVLCEFGALLAAQGDASLAITYLSNLDPSYSCVYGSADLIRAQAEDSLASADAVAVAPEGTNTGAQQGYGSYSQTCTYPSLQYTAPHGGQSSRFGVIPPQNTGNWSTPYNSSPTNGPQGFPPSGPTQPSAPGVTPLRPASVFGSHGPTAERSVYDPSAAYAVAPAYGQDSYPAPPQPSTPVTSTMPAPPLGSAMMQQTPSMLVVPPPPVPMNSVSMPPGGVAPSSLGTPYGMPSQSIPYGSSLGMQSQSIAPPPPPPPPPADASAPPPSSYHAKAKPGSGASLPPSAEVAVAEQRRSKPLSSSGTPGGLPQRSTSTSSSLSALGVETILLEKADVSKVPSNQQVIVKSLRGSFRYALSLNQSPIYRKKIDDVNKRLGRLVAGLNAGLVEPAVVELLLEVGRSIEKGNYDGASAVVQSLTKQHWDSNSQWIQGLKRLIDCVLTGR